MTITNTLKNTKIKIATAFARREAPLFTAQTFRAVQETMFKMGFRWLCLQDREVKEYPQAVWLFVNENCRITFCDSEDYGSRHNYREITMDELDTALIIRKQEKRDSKKDSRQRRQRRKLWESVHRTAEELDVASQVLAEAVFDVDAWQEQARLAGRQQVAPYVEPMRIKAADFSRKMEIGPVDYGVCTPDVNPKQSIGATALPMTMCSPLFRAMVALAKKNGSLKYGGANYIGSPVIMSTYLDAIQRHLDKIIMGEVVDEVDLIDHFGAIGANCDIIVSARAAGTLIDDRLRSDGQLEAYKALTPLVKSLTDLHKDRNPKHYYAKDKE